MLVSGMEFQIYCYDYLL